MKLKQVIYTVLLIIWMLVIFLFSSQDSISSESTSDKVTSSIVNTVKEVTNKEITQEEKEKIIDDTRVLVRKTAHFTLYFILGILSYLTLSSYSVDKKLIYAIILCFIYACSDEVHQLFISGRTFKILDILIDTTGSFISITLCSIINKKSKKRLKNIKSMI